MSETNHMANRMAEILMPDGPDWTYRVLGAEREGNASVSGELGDVYDGESRYHGYLDGPIAMNVLYKLAKFTDDEETINFLIEVWKSVSEKGLTATLQALSRGVGP